MPLYEFRCRECDTVFEARRSMSDAGEPIDCPDGHADTVRLLSVISMTGRSGAGAAPAMAGAPRSGGGCGGACACAH